MYYFLWQNSVPPSDLNVETLRSQTLLMRFDELQAVLMVRPCETRDGGRRAGGRRVCERMIDSVDATAGLRMRECARLGLTFLRDARIARSLFVATRRELVRVGKKRSVSATFDFVTQEAQATLPYLGFRTRAADLLLRLLGGLSHLRASALDLASKDGHRLATK